MKRRQAFRLIAAANKWSRWAGAKGATLGSLGDTLAAGCVGVRLYEVAEAVDARRYEKMFGDGTNRSHVGVACALAWWDRNVKVAK